MLSFEAPPTIDDACSCKTAGARRLYHCNDCFDFTACCATCFVNRHESNPFHWAEFWNGSFLERKDLSELGFIVPLKHGPDCDSCPRASPITFTIVDITGIHETQVALCRCLTEKHDRVDLLLRSQIFPATLDQPQLGFTFNVLRDFHLQTLTSKKSSYDYLTALRRKTNNGILSNISSPYSQFLRVQRLWRALTMIKRSGQVHQIDKEFPLRREGNLAVPCFACPEPGFNVPNEQWGSVDEELGFLNTLMLMMDGHFGLQRLAKVDDPDDVSLLDGHALFPPDERYNDYVRNTVAYSEEKSTCSKFNAVDMQNKLKFKGSVITGVIGVSCNRHMVFLSLIDLQKGERYANADFGLAYALERFVSHPSIKAGQFFPEILVTYDVACQYCVHLKSRFSSNFIHLSEAAASIRLLVPKKHLDGHKEDCKYRFSLNYSKGTGRGHGEGIEVSWSESKQSGASTRQMNHGHRHDTLNDLHNDWNWTKVQGLAESLAKRLKKAITSRMKAIDHFLGLSLVHGEEKVREWEKESTEPHRKNGEWQSVYRFKCGKLPSQASILQSLEQAEKNIVEHTEARESSLKQPALSRIIYTGIKLQDRQRELKRGGTTVDAEAINTRRSALATDIKLWRKAQVTVFPQLHDMIVNAEISTEPEKEKLFLPSEIDLKEHQELGLEAAAEHEFHLREGQANDSVKAICNAVMHGMVLRDEKRERARGVSQNTRALKQINSVKDKKNFHVSKYRFARSQILKLKGNDPSIMEDYPELKDEDTYAKNATSSRKVGDGKSVDSWIWSFGKLKGLNEEEKADFIRDSEFLITDFFVN
ncbi:hypothetical protein BDZ97DRAFT_1670418 [Flammula alnicola]|nr:hypothetical protein BDZ97DRAFT_1680403 [Flammula alnicola]KAF8957097.1 hypothetical protein BDZ97DRAFT_1670418 [Flammula alnicola]